MVYIGMSVLLASAPMLPVYAGKQVTSAETTPTTGGQMPSTNNPGQGGTQNTPDAPNTNTATPPQVVHQMAQASLSDAAKKGIGLAALGALSLVVYGISIHKGDVPGPKKLIHKAKNAISDRWWNNAQKQENSHDRL
jgi:hypothetical protein